MKFAYKIFFYTIKDLFFSEILYRGKWKTTIKLRDRFLER